MTTMKGLPANVSYYYNYENAPNGGFYWIDDYSNEYWIDDFNGEIIKYPPENPTREGYEFMGWYKEAECTNKWNFDVDIVPVKSYGVDSPDWNALRENYKYNETALYAKWNKN